MSGYRDNGTVLGRLATWLLIGIVALVALKVAAALTGAVLSLGFFLLFTVGPILLVGWLVMKLLRAFARTDRYSV